MPPFSTWSLSSESRQRLNGALDDARDLGLDPKAFAAAGLTGMRALLALRRVHDSAGKPTQPDHLARAQEVLRALNPKRHGALVQQMQARLLALHGRGGDTEVAHVTPGEVVIPRSLQTPEVMDAFSSAAARAKISLERLRVGTSENSVNPDTQAPEFYGVEPHRTPGRIDTAFPPNFDKNPAGEQQMALRPSEKLMILPMKKTAKDVLQAITNNAFDKEQLESIYQQVTNDIKIEDAKTFVTINPTENPITMNPLQAAIIRAQIGKLTPADSAVASEAFENALQNGRVRIRE